MESAESPPNPASPREEAVLPSPPSPSTGKGDQPSKAPKKSTVRRRTKTGCLTCRRRRIKCDEGKPTCNNCIKSKRECEGYSQRLTFKEPLGSFPSSHLYGHPVYNRPVQDALFNVQISAQNTAPSAQGPLAVIAPKPPSTDFSGAPPLTFAQGYGGPSIAGAPDFSPVHQLPSPPFVKTEPDSFPDIYPPPIHPSTSTHGIFFGGPATGVQGLQHNLGVAEVSPVFAAGHHVPLSAVSAPGEFLPSPGSGHGKFAQVLPAEEGYWESDDEASMGESDDGAVLDPHLVHLESNDLGIRVAQQLGPLHDPYGVRLRTSSGYGGDNILETYTPSSASSPLNDAQTAAVFWYFVNVTGQSMSLYERHPFDPTPMFQGHPVPKQRQHIWTYNFPIMAFNHPALMQAMLALGSLQKSKLEGSAPTAAMKHYHLSLRRIAKNYQSPHKRTQPATLAATLLLGFYEVWNSDHDKWCKHMWGARAVIRDIPFGRLTRDVLAYKQRQREQEIRDHGQYCHDVCFASHGDLSLDPGAVDADLIYQISGQVVDYDTSHGHILGDTPRSLRLTERDVETYDQLRDLYWWYCKMDVYQSFLGGTRPLMEYQQWTQCAPRGACGKIDSIYGTFDYCILLLGRLADFASRDLARKRRARKAQGPGGGPGPGPGMGRGQSPPSFPGLMPSSGRVTVPRGFSPPKDSPPSSDSADDMDLDLSTANALREWGEIRQAFDVFRARLGPDFEPMGPDLVPPEMTPFGPALMYRTYSIAGIWMNYYMGLVVLHRSHPSMPPIAVMAAGMAAQQTGRWANEIARIAAGLHEDTTHMTAISTLVGAAFIESCFPLFVAGVQFQDLQQRHWLIRRLRDIARLTGWQSARQIAEGCESGWNKAAQMGRGPPYHSPPTPDHHHRPGRPPAAAFGEPVWDRPRRLDRRIAEELGSTAGGESRLVLAKSEQTHYALGLLSVERDLETLDIGDDEEGVKEEEGVGGGGGFEEGGEGGDGLGL